MAPKYKLTYFNGRGFAEATRIMFACKGVEYVDHRIKNDEWPELKPTLPFRELPLLEFDGHTIAQSRAIARYVANELGFAGKNNIEAAQCDMVVDAVYDTMAVLTAFYIETDEARKATFHKKLFEVSYPTLANNLQKLLIANGKGVFVGDSVTWADIVVAHFLSGLQEFKNADTEDVLDKFPVVKEHINRTFEVPAIKKWIEKRPVTEF